MNHSRRDYASGELNEDSVPDNPLDLFVTWLDEARDDDRIDEAQAMTLATSTPEGKPSARVVLLRDFDESGFVFFTSYDSRKGNEMNSNPFAAAVFYWGPLERQIRLEGTVEQIDPRASDDYFASRPYKSRIGAIASDQSKPTNGRAELERRFTDAMNHHPEGKPVTRPDNWGGYSLRPTAIEFWQGRRSRMHDRLRYDREAENWRITRLDP